MIRRIAILAGAVLIVTLSAAAQGPAGVGSEGSAGQGSSLPFSPTPWQIAVIYQYNRINMTGSPFNTNGFQASVSRYFGDWFAVEALAGAGFGSTGSATAPPNLTAKSVFAGGGPRLAYRGHWRVEPWIHGLLGMEHFRFTQTAGLLGSNTSLGWMAGGGFDIPIISHFSIRAGADLLGTHFFSADQRNFQAGAGLVYNFSSVHNRAATRTSTARELRAISPN